MMTLESQIIRAIDKFADAAYKHNQFTLEGNSTKTNRQAKRILAAFTEIKEFGEPARVALRGLIEHEDDSIAAMAATYSLKYATEQSLNVLARIAKRTDLLGFRAEQAMMRWEEGSWQLE